MDRWKRAVFFRCGRPMSGAFYEPCPECAKNGVLVNYRTEFDLTGAKLPPRDNGQPGIYRFREFFALEKDAPVVSLGEGNTPLHRLDRIGKKLGFNNLHMKDESKNPVMSHKDRMCSLMVTRAMAEKAPGMVIASTGNQGAAVAAYASAADLPCIIFTTENVSDSMKVLMQAYGGKVFICHSMDERAIMMQQVVKELGYVPASGMTSPPMGSNCFAVDAYKTISYEVFEQLGNKAPDWFIVPISYGDTLYGIYKGMCDLKEMGCIEKLPRFGAAEVFGAVENTIAAGTNDPVEQKTEPSIQTSIAVGTAAYHTIEAVRAAEGEARSSRDDEALMMQKLLARTEGVFAEASSAASLVAAHKLLQEGKIDPDEKVVVLITSTGIKAPEVAKQWLPEVPYIDATMTSLREQMENNY